MVKGKCEEVEMPLDSCRRVLVREMRNEDRDTDMDRRERRMNKENYLEI